MTELESDTPDRPTRRWVDDGHTAKVFLGEGPERTTGLQVECPHERADWEDVPWADRPACRRATLEDGSPDQNWDGSSCLLKEYVADRRVHGPDGNPVMIAASIVFFAWETGHDCTVTVRPSTMRVCVDCGCTDDAACAEGCSWVTAAVEANQLCSSCAAMRVGGL